MRIKRIFIALAALSICRITIAEEPHIFTPKGLATRNIVIYGNSEPLITFWQDGRITVSKDAKPDEVAKQVIKVLQQLYPRAACHSGQAESKKWPADMPTVG